MIYDMADPTTSDNPQVAHQLLQCCTLWSAGTGIAWGDSGQITNKTDTKTNREEKCTILLLLQVKNGVIIPQPRLRLKDGANRNKFNQTWGSGIPLMLCLLIIAKRAPAALCVLLLWQATYLVRDNPPVLFTTTEYINIAFCCPGFIEKKKSRPFAFRLHLLILILIMLLVQQYSSSCIY